MKRHSSVGPVSESSCAFSMSVLGEAANSTSSNTSAPAKAPTAPKPRPRYANALRVPWHQGYYGSPLGHELPPRAGTQTLAKTWGRTPLPPPARTDSFRASRAVRAAGRLPMDTCSEDTPNCNKLWLKTGSSPEDLVRVRERSGTASPRFTNSPQSLVCFSYSPPSLVCFSYSPLSFSLSSLVCFSYSPPSLVCFSYSPHLLSVSPTVPHLL